MAGEVKKLSLSEGIALTTPTDLSFGTTVQFTIANNVAAALDVTGMLFAAATVKYVTVNYDLERRDDGQDATEAGLLFLSHDNENSLWLISQDARFDNAGVVFTITAAGQLQYTSTNFAGANYTGTARFLNITIAE